MRLPHARRLSGPVSSSQTLEFLRAVLRDPGRVGAVAPSGRALARLMTAGLTPDDVPIIELGPGTGAFTQALLDRGVAEQALALVEADEKLAANLRVRFPQARVLAINAAHLERLSGLFDEPAAGVVSGLPLLSLPPDDVAAILRGVFRHLREGGVLYQFTYLPRCPVPAHVMDELRLQATWIGSAWANLPPAFVFRITRRSGSSGSRPAPSGV
jgi:phosphatidylethanolamine/phosphatidyl-N-methylethanolamine N-methyltransferase